MITAEKPALNDDLLVHFGVKGQRWRARKLEEIPVRRPVAAQRLNYGGTRAPLKGRQPNKLPDRQKKAVKASVGIGHAAAGYFLAYRGTKERTAALSDKSTTAGGNAASKTMQVIGNISVKTAPNRLHQNPRIERR